MAAGQHDYISRSSSSRAKGLLPPYLHVPYISTHNPHALGHLSLFYEANRAPGKGRSRCSASPGFEHPLFAHTHRGSLYLTNNYLTKYANGIITVICLAVISVWNVNVNFGIFAGYVCVVVGFLSHPCVLPGLQFDEFLLVLEKKPP